MKLTFHHFLIVLPFECKRTELCTDLQKLNRYRQPLLFFLCMPTTHFINLKRSLCWWTLQLLQPYRTALNQSTRPLKVNPRAQHSMRWFCSHWKVLAKSLKTAQPLLASTRPQFFFIVRTTGVPLPYRKIDAWTACLHWFVHCQASHCLSQNTGNCHNIAKTQGRRTLLTTSLILTAIKKNSCRKRQLELLC